MSAHSLEIQVWKVMGIIAQNTEAKQEVNTKPKSQSERNAMFFTVQLVQVLKIYSHISQ